MKQTVIKHKMGILVAFLIICAMTARMIGKYGICVVPLGLTHTVICVGICVGWGLSVSSRILQKSVRRYIVGVAAMAVFWFFVRTLKYYFIFDPNIKRYLWYLYYIPMLSIPFFSLLASLMLEKSEEKRLPKWTAALYCIFTVLCIVVLSNDLHQLVFVFPEDAAVFSDENYLYGIGHAAVSTWILMCALGSVIIMGTKCRISYNRKLFVLPCVLIAFSALYCILYATGHTGVFGDLTFIIVTVVIAFFETCMKIGLIRTNTGYKSLFRAGSLGAVIVDNGNRIRYYSSNAPILNEEIIEQAKHGLAAIDRDTVLKYNPIDGGYVYWQEDITAMNAMLERLSENKEAIAESNLLEEENYRAKQRINALREKNRLYDLLQEKTAPQIALLDRLFTEYADETDTQKRRALLARIAVIGAYIKRCGNLLFIGEKNETTTTSELSLCVDESFANLKLMGVDCETDINEGIRIYAADAIRVYDFFERVIETALDKLYTVWLKSRVKDDEIIFRLEVECEASLEPLGENGKLEDGVWGFTLRIEKAVKQDG